MSLNFLSGRISTVLALAVEGALESGIPEWTLCDLGLGQFLVFFLKHCRVHLLIYLFKIIILANEN